jgi:tetratricopeptide (TPR) repeat protein
MKSKRQEELQKQTASINVPEWQDFLQRHSSRILLALTLVVLGVLIFRYRSQSALQREATARAAATRAEQDVRQLKQAVELAAAPPEAIAARRDQLAAQIKADLSEALADSADSDTTIRADAYTTRGDLYWTLANSPIFSEAATRPALALSESPDTLLSEAEADYRHVIEQYSSNIMDWAVAEFGLAAIAEDRSDWDKAQKHYDEIINRADAPELVKSAARMHLGLLDRLRQPVLVGPYSTTAPTTGPAISIPPTTAASTQPSR